MERYHATSVYVNFGRLISLSSITLQIVLLTKLGDYQVTLALGVLAFIVAYFLTDLLNGIIHMIMDHHENYTAFYGPLVAHFHLHHQTPKYTPRFLPIVYFNETGAKIWLLPYLMLLVFAPVASPFLMLVLIFIGVLSSVAEVSHYLCHTSDSRLVAVLGRMGILLSRRHHTPHHEQDNTNYAFLNGASDPLINFIARRYYSGYKGTTDQHFVTYAGTTAGHR